MRIIGGHDYYDSALAYGADPSVVFVREKWKVTDKLLEPPALHRYAYELYTVKDNNREWHYRVQGYDTLVRPVFVYFCGSSCHGVKVSTRDSLAIYRDTYFWDYADLNAHLAKLNLYLEQADHRSRLSFYGATSMEQHLAESGSKAELETCINHGIVTATWLPAPSAGEKSYWRINGDNLKDLQFYKAVDPYKAFQEISMFVGGVLPRSGNQMVEISDKSKVKKHGFDKWSFRKKGVNSK